MKASLKLFFSFLIPFSFSSCFIMAQQQNLVDGQVRAGKITYQINTSRGGQFTSIENVDNFQKLSKIDRDNKDKLEIIPMSALSVNESDLLKVKRDIVGDKTEIGVKFFVNAQNELFDVAYTLSKGNNISYDQLKILDKMVRENAKCKITIPKKYLKNYVPYTSRLIRFR